MSKVILNQDRITGRAKVNAPVAVVVGVGARNGLGGALSYRVAQAGYHVVMCGRTEAKMQNTKEKIELETIGSASVIVLKCIGPSSEFAVAETDGNLMEKEIIDAFKYAQTRGRIDLVVQNQGPNMFPPDGPDMRNMKSSFVKYMWQNNMLISFLVGREAARVMVAEGERSGPCVSYSFPLS